MKPLFLIFFLLIAFQSKATNDTLTRAQVYNFNVGDTFDYRHYYNAYGDNGGYDTTSISYMRYVITNNYYSLDSTTKFIVRQQLFPLPLQVDTLTIQSLNGIVVLSDTGDCFSAGIQSDIITFEPTSQYYNRITNSSFLMCDYPISEELIWGEGLGVVLQYTPQGTQIYGFTIDSVVLIYYSKGTETWGIPYYDFPSGLSQLYPANNQITLFPTINTGQFKIKIANGNSPNYQLVVYDLTGQAVKTATLNNGISNIEMPNTSKGMYLWRVISEGAVLQTGKLIVE